MSGTTGFRNQFNGLTLVPQNTTAPSGLGSIRYNSSSNKLEVFNGSLDPMVTELKAATLVNKTINGPDNTLTNIAYSSLVLTDSIVNADVASAAAIAYSKLALNNSIKASDINAQASTASFVLTSNGDGTASFLINGSGVTTVGTVNSQTKSSDGAVILGTSLVMQDADVSFRGLVNTTTQSIAGAKTFTTSASSPHLVGSTDVSTPSLLLTGSTSGTFSAQAAAITSSYSVILPAAQGAGNLQNDGSGNLSWSSAISKNLLINSKFDFWQRGTSVTVANTQSTYQADRWYVKNTLGTTGVITYSRVSATSSLRAIYDGKVQITTAPTASQANGCELYQAIEPRSAYSLFNTNVTFSIKIKSLGNVNQVGIQLFYNNSHGKLTDALGTEQLVTVNSSTWTLGALLNQLVDTNLVGAGATVGVRIRITGVSTGNTYDLNNGFLVNEAMLTQTATSVPFDTMGSNYGEELILCQRYYEKTYDVEVSPGSITGAGKATGRTSSTTAVANLTLHTSFKVSKYIDTTVTLYNASTGASGTWRDGSATDQDMTTFNTGMNTTEIENSNSMGPGIFISGHWTAESEI